MNDPSFIAANRERETNGRNHHADRIQGESMVGLLPDLQRGCREVDALPRCAQCGSSYCPTCMTNGEPSLLCAGDPAACPLGLQAPDPSAAA